VRDGAFQIYTFQSTKQTILNSFTTNSLNWETQSKDKKTPPFGNEGVDLTDIINVLIGKRLNR